MQTGVSANTASLLDALRTHGVASARQLAGALSVSQPTVSRLLRAAGEHVVAVGETRRRRYVASRDVRGLGSTWPLYRINAHGRPSRLGILRALHGGRFHFKPDGKLAWLRGEFADGLFPDLPWFLHNMRPQGFLGQLFAQRFGPGIGLRDELASWNNDDILIALLLSGADPPGQFILGEQALERALGHTPHVIAGAQCQRAYAMLADATMAGAPPSSLVPGEQPKFTACIRGDDDQQRHVIVKFSDGMPYNAISQRWADLLLAEHVANQVLRTHGIVCANTTVLETTDGRRCLQSNRFDRIGAHGRMGLVSLAALDDAHGGQRDDWAQAAQRLLDGGWIDAADAWRLTLCWWFGRLIGNTDMHFGNVGFFLDKALPLRLAPVYDMLPMHFRPASNGAVTNQAFTPPPPQPESMVTWQQAVRLAGMFWQQLGDDPALSDDFRSLAVVQTRALATLQQRFG